MTTPPDETNQPTPPHPAPASVKNGRRRQVGWRSRDIVRGAALILGLYWLSRLFWFANPLFLTIFLGILFGLAVSSGVDKLENLRIPRGIGAALIVLSFIGALVGFGASVAPTLREQGAELQRKIPEAIDRLEHWVAKKQRGPLGIVMGGAPPPDTATADSTTPSPSVGQVPTSPAPAAASSATQAPAAPAAEQSSLRSRLGSQFGSVTRYLFPFLHSTIAAIAGLLLIIFLAIYIAADPDLYHRGMIAMFPRRHRPRVGEVFSAIAGVLRKWLVTQLIAMTAIGVVTTIVLLILDVKAAFALGVIAGLLEFVPTVGPILSGVPAVAMAFLDSPQKALYVGIAYIGIQFLENHLLIPLLMKGGMDLPPALTIIAQALMALVFGFIGLMCAVPLLAAGMVAFKMLYLERVIGEKPFAKGQDPQKGFK
ncbi:MAG: AI-2E family transporter [Gemmatimonadaceae bacterium]